MNFKQLRGEATIGQTHITMIAIAVIALIAAGLAFQFTGQKRPVTIAQVGGPAQTAVAPLPQKDTARYSVSKSSPYCPAGASNAEEGSGTSICNTIWGKGSSLGAIGNIWLVSQAREIAGKGASKLSPIIQLIADNCLPFLK